MGRLAAFRTAQKGATGAPGLALDQAIVDRLRKVTPRDLPDPEPLPDARAVSTLTLTCPAGGKPGNYALNGTLTAPVPSGAAVELHITPPGGPEAVQTVTTNATGTYAGSFTPPSAGTWTIFARWPGDANSRPDDSPVCQVAIT